MTDFEIGQLVIYREKIYEIIEINQGDGSCDISVPGNPDDNLHGIKKSELSSTLDITKRNILE